MKYFSRTLATRCSNHSPRHVEDDGEEDEGGDGVDHLGHGHHRSREHLSQFLLLLGRRCQKGMKDDCPDDATEGKGEGEGEGQS